MAHQPPYPEMLLPQLTFRPSLYHPTRKREMIHLTQLLLQSLKCFTVGNHLLRYRTPYTRSFSLWTEPLSFEVLPIKFVLAFFLLVKCKIFDTFVPSLTATNRIYPIKKSIFKKICNQIRKVKTNPVIVLSYLMKKKTTDNFLLAFRQYISRRGILQIVYTDNGTNFVGSIFLLKKVD